MLIYIFFTNIHVPLTMGIDSPFQVKCLEKKSTRKRETKLIALQKLFISIVHNLIHSIFTNQQTENHPGIANMYIEPQGHHAWRWPAFFSEIKL